MSQLVSRPLPRAERGYSRWVPTRSHQPQFLVSRCTEQHPVRSHLVWFTTDVYVMCWCVCAPSGFDVRSEVDNLTCRNVLNVAEIALIVIKNPRQNLEAV